MAHDFVVIEELNLVYIYMLLLFKRSYMEVLLHGDSLKFLCPNLHKKQTHLPIVNTESHSSMFLKYHYAYIHSVKSIYLLLFISVFLQKKYF